MNYFEKYSSQVIRPPRRTYQDWDLGPRVRYLNTKPILRQDFEFISRNLKLKASYFIRHDSQHRCLIYLHGNASCRIEGIQHIEFLAKLRINLCVLDFAGCGMSEGEYISMGFYESQDVLNLMNYIEINYGKVDEFILWGRSMGAVTALMLANEKRVSTFICDSAFSNFRTLIKEIGSKQFGFLSFLLCIGLPLLRKKILEIGKFDIDQIDPLQKIIGVNKKFYFIASQDDQLITNAHTKLLYQTCTSLDKFIDICPGDHNSSPRPISVMYKIQEFLTTNLNTINEEYLQVVTSCMLPPEVQTNAVINMAKDLERRCSGNLFIESAKDQREYDFSDIDQYLQ